MAPTFKLTYFSLTALGEPIRWLLSYSNIDFEDIRVNKGEWPDVKPRIPFGKLPILEVDGKEITSSTAICRWLAKQANLTGKNEWDALQADAIVDAICDFKDYLVAYYYDENEETRAPKKEPLLQTTVPFYLARFEKIVGENDGYFVGGQLTWADIFFVAVSEYWEMMADGADFFTDHPNLAQLKQKVESIPQIKQWIATRPANIPFR